MDKTEQANSFLNIIRSIIKEEQNKRDRVEICQIDSVNEDGTVNIKMLSDFESIRIIPNISNQSIYSFKSGDLAIIYMIQNQLSNAFIIAKCGPTNESLRISSSDGNTTGDGTVIQNITYQNVTASGVTSINGKTGEVTITAQDLGAITEIPDVTQIQSTDISSLVYDTTNGAAFEINNSIIFSDGTENNSLLKFNLPIIGINGISIDKANGKNVLEISGKDLQDLINSISLTSGTNNGTLKLTVGTTVVDNIKVTGFDQKQDQLSTSQLNAVNSGITSAKVTTYDGYQAKIDAKYTKPTGGIPKTDLSSAVQTSLGKADSALQSHQQITTGSANGTIAVGGTDVAVKGLGSLAYKNSLTKSDVGLGNVENKSSATIRSEITSSNVTTALGYTPLNSSLKGANSGIAELDENGKIPSSQLPSYVDDCVEGYLYNNKLYKESSHTTEISGESGKIYIDLASNKTYRWSGSAFVEISASLALGETSSTAYRGDRGKIAYNHSQAAHAPSNAEKNIIVGVQRNGTDLTVDSNRKVNITVPTKTSELSNDSGFTTSSDIPKASTTSPKAAGTAAVGTESAYARGDHVHPSDSTKVDKVSGKGLSTNDYTTAEKNKLSGIASGAEVNQNAFSNIIVGSTTIEADSKTDTLTLVAGSNITLTPDATNDKVTIVAKDTTYSAGDGISLSGNKFSNTGVRAISTGSSNGTISVNTNGTSANVAVKGLGTAAYTDSSAYAKLSSDNTFTGSNTFNKTISGSISGNAATATKATQDGDGKTISSTYAKLSGATFSGDVIVNAPHRDTYYASNLCRHFSANTPNQFVIKTKIKYASGIHMPVIRIYGYAYGLQSPIELRVGFYIFDNHLGWAGVSCTGAWKPEVYLFSYTENSTKYVAVGFKGSCYFCGFQVDAQIGASGSFGSNFAIDGWSTINNGSDTSVNLIPSVGTDNCIKVDYKPMQTDISGNASTATKATQDGNGNTITSTYIKGLSASGQTITYTKGDGSTGTITTQDTTYSAGTHISINGTTINASWPTASDSGYAGINKTGTVTGVKVNGTTKSPTDGIVDIGPVPTVVQTTGTSTANVMSQNSVTNELNKKADLFVKETEVNQINPGKSYELGDLGGASSAVDFPTINATEFTSINDVSQICFRASANFVMNMPSTAYLCIGDGLSSDKTKLTTVSGKSYCITVGYTPFGIQIVSAIVDVL